MSSRYDALRASEDRNGSVPLQTDQNIRTTSRNSSISIQLYEAQDFSAASKLSIDSTQQREEQDDRVASEGSINFGQQYKDEGVRTFTGPVHRAEMSLRQPATIVRRVGKLPCTLLVLSIFGTAAFVIYITFLWFTASGNKTWKDIALSGWMTRSVAIAAVVLRTSSTVQAGVASSMLAAIALESTAGVTLPDLVPLSLMRSSSAAPYALLAHTRLGRNRQDWLLIAFAVIISVTTVSLQFTSTILLADVNAGFIPSGLVPYTFVLPNPERTGYLVDSWRSAPRPWPVFAEYTKNDSADGSRGYSDTGFTMRALLPFGDTQSRTFIQAYEGPAPVIDARTICVRPNVTNTRVYANDTYGYKVVIEGDISASDDLLPILQTETPFKALETNRFSCLLSNNFLWDYYRKLDATTDYLVQLLTSAWDLTVCTFGGAYDTHLPTSFAYGDEENVFQSSSVPFLLINYTGFVDQQVHNRTKFPPLELANFNDTTPGLHYHPRNEWLDLKQDSQTLDSSDGNNFAETKLSFSLCVKVFNGWLLNVSASSQAPLEESTYSYDTERSQYRYDKVRKQLLRSSVLPLEERNVLSLHPQSWLIPNDTEQGISSYLYPLGELESMMFLSVTDLPITQRSLSLLDDVMDLHPRSHKNIGGLGLEILQEGGTPAEALQSMLMTVALADYQQYAFTEVPNGTPNSTSALRSDFVTAQVPGGNGRPVNRPAGATRSYLIVMIATAIHTIAVFTVFMLFIKSTKNTLIWESWHTVAQSISAMTEPYLSQANLATDSEIKKQMKIDGTSDQAVSIRTDDSGVRAEVGIIKQRLKSTRVEKDSQSDLLMEELRSVRDGER